MVVPPKEEGLGRWRCDPPGFQAPRCPKAAVRLQYYPARELMSFGVSWMPGQPAMGG